MENKELRVDRLEDGIAIAYDKNGNRYEMCGRIADLSENDLIFAAIGDGGEVLAATVLPEKTEKIKRDLHVRLQKMLDGKETK